MNEAGLKKIAELNVDMNDLRSGFHWPPTNSINHLHQHFISPGRQISFIKKFFYSSSNFWFVNVSSLHIKKFYNYI
jgi:hypothetical protein